MSGRRLPLALAVASLAVGGIALTAAELGDHHRLIPLDPALSVFVGWSFCAAGVIAAWRRPANHTGILLTVVGLTWFANVLVDSDSPALYTLGLLGNALVYAAIAHLLLAYPDGALHGRFERRLIASGYALAILAPLLTTLFNRDPAQCGDGCPRNLMVVANRPGLEHAITQVVQVLAALLLGTVFVLVVRRWRSGTSAYRRTVAPVLAAGGACVALLVAAFLVAGLSDDAATVLSLFALAALALIPMLLVAGLLRRRRTVTSVGRSVTELGAAGPGALRAVLRDALADPSLELAYRHGGVYVDAEGRRVELPTDERRTTVIDDEDGPIAVVIHDPALASEPELLHAATATARLTLLNERYQAELRTVADEQAALRRVATLVATGPSEAVLLAQVTREVGLLFGVQSANMVRYEDDGVRVLGGWSAPGARSIPNGTFLELAGDAAVRRVRDTMRPARIESYHGVQGTLAAAAHDLGVRAGIAAPVIVEGRPWGAITASRSTEEQFAEGAEQRLADFAALVAQAIGNATARAELSASRARIVEAADDARRKIERNLHDGAQQRLVALALALRLARARVKEDPAAADALLAGAADELSQALEELRELARGIHPAVLTDHGLGPALRALAHRAPVEVTIRDEISDRIPPQAEAAAYYVVSESLANVAKYAEASEVRVRVSRRNGVAEVEVADDGVGGADPSAGSGLRGLTDRIEALDGSLEVESPPGKGTRIRASIPLS